MRKLVIGGSGFIGRHLVRELAKESEVTVLDVAVDDELEAALPDVGFFEESITMATDRQWADMLEGVDTVFHLGGLLGTSELYDRVLEAEYINVYGTLKLLEAMRRNGKPRLCFASKPNMWRHNVYTITKEHCERYIEMYQLVHGLEAVIYRPFNVYGPEEKVLEYRKAVPYFIISALKGEPLEVFGDGRQTMDLIYVQDCIEAFIALSQNDRAVGEVIEIGSGCETEVNALADMVIALTGSSSPVVHIPMRKGETPESRIRANRTALEETCRLMTYTPLEVGLVKTIEHYSEHLEDYPVYALGAEELVL